MSRFVKIVFAAIRNTRWFLAENDVGKWWERRVMPGAYIGMLKALLTFVVWVKPSGAEQVREPVRLRCR